MTVTVRLVERPYIWGQIQILRLHRNMRLGSAGAEEVDFANWLLDVGHGRGIADDGTIPLRANMAWPDIENLINYILAARNNDRRDGSQ